MTQYSKATLTTFFQQNDVPQGTDYANLISSYVNQVDTAEQAMAGALNTTELIASRVSAGILNVTGAVTFGGSFSPAGGLSTTTGTFTGNVSASDAYVSTINASASRVTIALNPVAIISAAGSAQGTASPCSAAICRLAGVVDGQTTGFALMANRAGWEQKLYGANASANLWPPTGGTINALGANLPFALAVNTLYDVVHLTASAYAVK